MGEKEPWRRGISKWGTVVDLGGCSFGLDRNDVCDNLLCKFRCATNLSPLEQVKIGALLCPRNNECHPYEHLEEVVADG